MILPFPAISAYKESIYGHVRIRICHPIAVCRIMRFPMLPQNRLEFELFSTALKCADILDVTILLVFTHLGLIFERHLALFEWAKDLKKMHSHHSKSHKSWKIITEIVFVKKCKAKTLRQISKAAWYLTLKKINLWVNKYLTDFFSTISTSFSKGIWHFWSGQKTWKNAFTSFRITQKLKDHHWNSFCKEMQSKNPEANFQG